MYLTRSKTLKRIPISRKGTKYLAKALNHSNEGVSVVVAIRDMLRLAKTSKEVKLMVKQRLLKLNGKIVKDCKEGICLFNILDADKRYRLTILETGRLSFEEIKDSSRIAKVIGKTNIKGNVMQVNFHDGTNILTKEKIRVGDSVELDFNNKIEKVNKIEKGKNIFVISGRSIGSKGKINEIEMKKVKVQLGGREVVLDNSHLVVL